MIEYISVFIDEELNGGFLRRFHYRAIMVNGQVILDSLQVYTVILL